MSSPASSSAGLTRTGVKMLMMRRITYDPAKAKAATMTQAKAWIPSWPGFPKNRPFGPPELIRVDANRPVASVPQMPPAPWHAKTSSESSRVVRARQLPTKLHRTPATSPMMIDGIGPTYPEAGVMATSPQTAPTAIPTADGFFFLTQSVSIQLTAAPAAARFVTTSAFTASSFALRALPALKPNHPNHSTEAPRITYGMLFGRLSRRSMPWRRPMTRAAATADTPAAVWTTRPPAKSMTPRVLRKPPMPQFQWAIVETRFFRRTSPP